jgi:hypothetical protein
VGASVSSAVRFAAGFAVGAAVGAAAGAAVGAPVGGAARGTDAANHRKREAKFRAPSDSKFLDLFCLKEKIEWSRRAHLLQKRAHITCAVMQLTFTVGSL